MTDDTDLKMPMDGMDDAPQTAPANDTTPDTAPQNDRARDEAGRFAPKPEGPRGEPNDEIARRRYAQERDQARNEAAEIKQLYEALEKRLADMAAIVKGDDPEAKPADPLAPINEQLTKITQRFETEDQQRQAEETHRQVLAYSDQDEARFRQTNPDFPQAAQHYIHSRLTEMQALGYGQTQAESALAEEAKALLYQCAQANRSPAEALYAMAKARGFTSGASPVPAPTPAPANQNFGGRTMGTGNGPAGGAMTAQQIAALSEEDYMAFRATPEGQRAIRRAMGQ
jgi:hypothetical protein